jgi:hypothetical protein
MIQCSECEFFERGPNGQLTFKCDPFSTIKEPECLAKWQLLRTAELGRMDRMIAAYEATWRSTSASAAPERCSATWARDRRSRRGRLVEV